MVLFKYPPGKKLALRLKDLAAFCFPGGVEAGIFERTPSLPELTELLYGQGHLCRDDLSFIFSLKELFIKDLMLPMRFVEFDEFSMSRLWLWSLYVIGKRSGFVGVLSAVVVSLIPIIRIF
ncbi:hypothetical protein Pfo_006502, partial [Paulownia fortunei]